MRIRLLLVLTASAALASCSWHTEPSPGFPDLQDATEANEAMLDRPACEAVPRPLLRDLSAPGPGQPDRNPIWTGCRWDLAGHGTLEVRIGTLGSLNDPAFERDDITYITELRDPTVRRIGIVDGDPDDECSALMIELADDGGFMEVSICGPGADRSIRSSGVEIARALLDAQA